MAPKKTPRERARENVKSMSEKSKELLDAVKQNYDDNTAAMKDLADAALADEPPEAGKYAGDVVAAAVNSWGSYLDLADKVARMWIKPKA